MNRRSFLKVLTSGAAAALVLDPERLLWTPGAKTIFLPPVKQLEVADYVTTFRFGERYAMLGPEGRQFPVTLKKEVVGVSLTRAQVDQLRGMPESVAHGVLELKWAEQNPTAIRARLIREERNRQAAQAGHRYAQRLQFGDAVGWPTERELGRRL